MSLRHKILPLLLLCCALQLSAAIVRVGKAKATPTTSAGTSISKAYTPTSGNAVFILFSSYKSGGDSGVLTVTCGDGGTNTYTQDVTVISAGNTNARAYIFHNYSVTGGAFTYQCTWVGNRFSTMEIVEYSGLTGVADGTGSNASTGTTVVSGGIATTNATDLVLGQCGLNEGGGPLTWTMNDTFIELDNSNNCATAMCSISMERIVSATGTYTAGVLATNFTGAGGWGCVSAAYKGTNPSATAGNRALLGVGQ